MSELTKTALLLLGHGSSKHPDSSRSVRMHAELLRGQGTFAEIHVAFLKEEPLVADSLARIDSDDIRVVPDFLAEGYFTRDVIPGLLDLEAQPESCSYCDPVGTHPMIQELIQQSAQDVLGTWKSEEVSLLMIGHGSTRNSQSKQTLLDHIGALKETSAFSQITDLWLEEAPFVNDWQSVATQKQIIVVPFLLSDGQHGGWDIPEMLGLEQGAAVHAVTHKVGVRQLRIAPALGTSPSFVEVIEAVAKKK